MDSVFALPVVIGAAFNLPFFAFVCLIQITLIGAE